MSTKLSTKGTYLEYLIIRPIGGLNITQIADAILIYDNDAESVAKFFKVNNTWNKVMSKVKRIIYEEGMVRVDYAWENVSDYKVIVKTVEENLRKLNKLIGTEKQ